MILRIAAWLGLFNGIGRMLALEVSDQPAVTHANVSYGPDQRNVLDFWRAPGNGPRPLLVYIHGGGWITGDKTQKMPAFQPFLDRGISCAAINYRLAPDHPLPAPVDDAARALQFLRTQAAEWNINASRIALTGPSAGACTSMWLLLHDDLADPRAVDRVRRESTRVCAAAVTVGQTSIDPKVIEGWLGPNVLQHPMIVRSVGEKTFGEALRNYDRHHDLYVEFSPINHLDSRDPPLFMTCSAEMDLPARDPGHGIHHPVYGVKLKEKSDQVGHECHLIIPGVSKSERYADGNDFLIAKLLAK
ncbi:MAG: hypothetical protein RIS76_796 [Verrucomicrobiota bacterium]|jgi:acetyl esterase/lipase